MPHDVTSVTGQILIQLHVRQPGTGASVSWPKMANLFPRNVYLHLLQPQVQFMRKCACSVHVDFCLINVIRAVQTTRRSEAPVLMAGGLIEKGKENDLALEIELVRRDFRVLQPCDFEFQEFFNRFTNFFITNPSPLLSRTLLSANLHTDAVNDWLIRTLTCLAKETIPG